jgi:hypothetical protein
MKPREEESNNGGDEDIMNPLLCKLIKRGWIFDNRDIAVELCEGFYNILEEPYCDFCAMPGVELKIVDHI